MKRPDHRFVENINERCRPTTVAAQYNQLESQEWVDAKEALEEAGFEDEEAATQFLADILMVWQELLYINTTFCIWETWAEYFLTQLVGLGSFLERYGFVWKKYCL